MSKNNKTLQWSHVSPYCLIRNLVRHCWMIVAATLVMSMSVTLLINWFHVPKYRASMTYAVNSRTTSYTSSGNLTSTREVAAVLTDFLGTDVMRDGLKEADPRLANFDGTITATQMGESNFIEVSCTASTPEQAFLALKAVTNVFPKMAGFISSRSVLNVLRNPTVSSYPSNIIDVNRFSKLAGILGAVGMVALLCYFSIQSETIQTRTGARQLLDAPVIASVSHERKNRTIKSMLQQSNRQVQVFSPSTSFSYIEQISSICTQLEHEAEARGRKIFMITGVGENEGKSTVAGNVAVALALKGYNVALVDGDLRKPALNKFLGNTYKSSMPLNKLLARPYSRENLLQCMVRNEQQGLYMLFPQGSDNRSTELVSSHTMDTLITQLRVFDFVIMDTPPMGMFSDAEVLAEKVDGTMLVVRQDYTAACDINDAIDSLRMYKAGFLGVILNDMVTSQRGRYGYHYGGQYGQTRSHGESHHNSTGKEK